MRKLILSIICAIVFTNAPIVYASIATDYASPQLYPSEVISTLSTGDTILYYDPSDSFLSSDTSPSSFTPAGGSGIYTFVECDSTVLLSDCSGTSLVSQIADVGYVSSITFEWTEPSDQYSSTYQEVTSLLPQMFLTLALISLIIGVAVRFMRNPHI